MIYYCSNSECKQPITIPHWASMPLDRTIELAWCEKCILEVTQDKELKIDLNSKIDYRFVRGHLHERV